MTAETAFWSLCYAYSLWHGMHHPRAVQSAGFAHDSDFRVGAHSLPVEQGRIEMPKVPRHLRRCTFCATNAIGDERHCVFDCPHFQGLRQQHAEIFRDSHDAMRSVMWHKDQKSVCALVLAIVNEA